MQRRYFNPVVVMVCVLMALLCGSCSDDDNDNDDSDQARWTVLLWLNGDNNLESLIMHDLNELETVGSGDGIHVVVQVDRIEGFSTADGDWTGTRRYYIEQDDDKHAVTSPIIEDLGEVDMGDPHEVSDFLLWANTNYPAERYTLIFWDHGDGWTQGHSNVNANIQGVSWDSTSGSFLSIARGDLQAALADMVSLRGPIDIIGFDACYMSAWEVAHSLREQAVIMTASESWVGVEGYMYGPLLALMREHPEATPADIAIEMCRGAVMDGAELTYAAIDLTGMDQLASTIDVLAGGVLSNSALEPQLMSARQLARGVDSWKNWYLDLRDLATVLATNSSDPFLTAAGYSILDAMDQTVIVSYGSGPYEWAGGLSIFFSLDWPDTLDLYHTGEGATWSEATRWDDLLLVLATNY